MTRVLHVLNDVENYGNGIVNAVVDLACEQRQQGHVVWVASAGGSYEKLLAHHGVEHVDVPDVRRPRAVLASARLVRRHVQQHAVDVVHSHMNFMTVVARLAVTGTRAHLVASAHTAFKRESALLHLADVVFAFGEAGRRTMRRRGVPAAKLWTLQNGTVGSVRADGARVAELARPSIVTVAGLYPRKGIDLLIQAFDAVAMAHPDAHLHLVGDGPGRRDYQQQASRTAAADRIHFHGFQMDAASFLRAADVFVLPSRRDPFPLVVLEAREAGCAIIASDVDGIPEACDGGEAGWLFPVDDVWSLTQALSALLSDEAVLRSWQAAAKSSLDRFTIARVAHDVEAGYRSAISSSGR